MFSPLPYACKSGKDSAAEYIRMGSAVSVGKSSDARGKSLVTQLRQENVRLHARVDRLCVEGKRLNEEINTMLKEREKEEEDLRIKCERFIHHSPTNGM